MRQKAEGVLENEKLYNTKLSLGKCHLFPKSLVNLYLLRLVILIRKLLVF